MASILDAVRRSAKAGMSLPSSKGVQPPAAIGQGLQLEPLVRPAGLMKKKPNPAQGPKSATLRAMGTKHLGA
jgi:hypothetical protein